jgi:hypothetical protein
MADFRPTASGLFWSTTSSWSIASGATWVPATSLPGIGDNIYLSGSSITIDIDATSSVKATLITNRAKATSPTAAAGGAILCSLNHQIITITASVIDSNSGLSFLTISGNCNNVTISSSISASSAPTTAGMIHNTGRYNTYNIIGNCINTNVGNPTSRLFTDVGSSTTIIINGNITGSGNNGMFYLPNYGPTITINGNILGNAINFSTPTNALIIVNGNINVSGASTTNGIPMSFGGVLGVATSINGNIVAGPSASAYISSAADHILVVRGNLTNTGSGYTAVSSPRLILTGSAIYNVVTSSGGSPMPFLTSSTFNTSYYPLATNVRSNISYGDGTNVSRTGSMIVPSPNDVRYLTPVNTSSATGLIILPPANDIRLGTPFDTGSTGLIYIPVASAVSQSVVYDNGTIGTYTGLDDFWSFGTSSFGTTGSGKIFQNNLDVKVGSVSSSMMSALNDTSTTNPTVKRLQNLARVQDMGDQVASSSYV